jgi:hypothetical protein
MAAMAASAVFTAVTAARADETDFQKRFTAAWSGGGSVLRDADKAPKPTKVSCTMAGSASGDAIAIDGTCRAYLLFSRPFEAKVRYDASSGRYVGVYEGANSGPATLSGRREGDTLNLTITWAKPVNGDRTARLSIRNDGRSIAVKMMDEAQGRQVTTTDLVFAQR